MPFIFDNILVFLWRNIAQIIREIRCRNWLIVIGTIDNVDCPKREMYPYVEIHYCYQGGDEDYDDRCLWGFWFDDSAQALAGRYTKLQSIKVRYSADNPANSYILDDDQRCH